VIWGVCFGGILLIAAGLRLADLYCQKANAEIEEEWDA